MPISAPLPEHLRPVENRDQLVALLTEAAEIEHCLMCTYLYGAFSMRAGEDDGLVGAELEAVRRWRVETLRIANEEMLHLALVNNLLVAIGARPHYRRPNFPVAPGAFPSDVALELAPFDEQAMDHFVYLERPADIAEPDAPRYAEDKGDYERVAPKRRLMPFAQDYSTVGELYAVIAATFESLAETLGERALFDGAVDAQLSAADFRLPGLCRVTNVGEALAAIDYVVRQGEGSRADVAGSHYARFSAMRREWHELKRANPRFRPWWPVARHPVMRSPVVPDERVQITAEPAALLVDAGNACYALSLRLMALLADEEVLDPARRRSVADEALALMYLQADIGTRLARLPANDDCPGVNAGLTFTLSRSDLAFTSPRATSRALAERYAALAKRLDGLTPQLPALQRYTPRLAQAAAEWAVLAAQGIRAESLDTAREAGQAAVATYAPRGEHGQSAVPTSPREGDTRVESVAGREVVVRFDHGRCIHARFCVTGEPEVFRANTPGEWIHPDAATPERIAIVARQCPSGAITYDRKDGAPGEELPRVNTVRIRENGPLAFNAPLSIDGVDAGLRATLCRCGLSKRKPFCDGSHAEGGFEASGEPPTRESEPLADRAGPLALRLVANGPLDVTGNLEILSGTGRTVDRVTCARLCRCGRSNTKPFCDYSHEAAGFRAGGA
jgi:CDGSH-type Zn-finger protein/uncharacterized Fe-S cluster protein YjdI